MKNKTTNETNVENNAQKSIKWENIDALIGVESEQETLDFSEPAETEGLVENIDDSQKKHGITKNIRLAVIATVAVVSLGVGILALSNQEPTVTLGEYKEVDIERGDNFANEVWAMLVNGSTVDNYPDKELEAIKNAEAARIEKQAEQYGLSLEQYISNMAMDLEAYDHYLMETAKQAYLSRRVANAVATAEGIEPKADEYDDLVQTMCEQMGYIDAQAAIDVGYTMEELKYIVLSNIVREWLEENTTTLNGDVIEREEVVEESQSVEMEDDAQNDTVEEDEE